MTKQENEERLARLKNIVLSMPEKPGSYQYYDENHTIIYVGKAKNLKRRVSSYFHKEVDRYKTKVLVSKIHDISYTVVNTEEDALLLENSLIKKYNPRYNVLLKDGKTYPSICVTNEILNDLYGKELDVWRLERSGEAGDTGDYLSNERIRYECAKAAARRELEYRDVRRRAIEDTYGLRPGTSLTFEDIERTFRKNNRSEEKAQLFEQAVSVVKKLGIDFGVGDDGPNGAAGKAIADREITLFVDGLSKTATRHKMIYQIQSFTKCCIKQQWEPFIL